MDELYAYEEAEETLRLFAKCIRLSWYRNNSSHSYLFLALNP